MMPGSARDRWEVRERWVGQGKMGRSDKDGWVRERWVGQGKMGGSGIDGWVRERWVGQG